MTPAQPKDAEVEGISSREPSPAFGGVVLTLAEAINLRMSERRMSFRDAAPEVGISVATLNRCARGKTPTLKTFYRLKSWLQIDAADTSERHDLAREDSK